MKKCSRHRPWRFPRIIGADFSGIITECGSQVKNFKVGDEVRAGECHTCH
ncbi:alcohol dehydrogenase catalytic domain-containing protein [Paenibacillus sp. Leaf72]